MARKRKEVKLYVIDWSGEGPVLADVMAFDRPKTWLIQGGMQYSWSPVVLKPTEEHEGCGRYHLSAVSAWARYANVQQWSLTNALDAVEKAKRNLEVASEQLVRVAKEGE